MLNHGLFCGLLEKIYGQWSDYAVIQTRIVDHFLGQTQEQQKEDEAWKSTEIFLKENDMPPVEKEFRDENDDGGDLSEGAIYILFLN